MTFKGYHPVNNNEKCSKTAILTGASQGRLTYYGDDQEKQKARLTF